MRKKKRVTEIESLIVSEIVSEKGIESMIVSEIVSETVIVIVIRDVKETEKGIEREEEMAPSKKTGIEKGIRITIVTETATAIAVVSAVEIVTEERIGIKSPGERNPAAEIAAIRTNPQLRQTTSPIS